MQKVSMSLGSLYETGQQNARFCIENSKTPEDVAELLIKRNRGLVDQYSLGIYNAAETYLKEKKDVS